MRDGDTLRIIARGLFAVILFAAFSPVSAEPYLAVAKGMHCSNCHSNPAGGGKRNIYGNVFAQVELPARRLGDPAAKLWTGEVFDWLSVGANIRGGFESVDTPNSPSQSDFDFRLAAVYIEAGLIPNRLSLYIDQRVAPDAIENREFYLKWKTADSRFQLALGQFFLPYGLRLQDDSAFVRQASGVNFNIPDRGALASYEAGPWSAQFSLTNGNGSGAVLDSTDQKSLLVQYVKQSWRAGISFNRNSTADGERQMQNLFVGVKTGPVAWLAELDFISDKVPGILSQDKIAGLLEGNWLFRKGHNLKVSHEYLDPDDSIEEDQQVRWSILWEYTPMQFLQSRAGVRRYDGVPQVDSQNRDEVFVELHAFF